MNFKENVEPATGTADLEKTADIYRFSKQERKAHKVSKKKDYIVYIKVSRGQSMKGILLEVTLQD